MPFMQTLLVMQVLECLMISIKNKLFIGKIVIPILDSSDYSIEL